MASDLSLSKSHTGNFTPNTDAAYTLTVSTNAAANCTTGVITATDTLPAGLTYLSASGTNWSCSASNQTVTCTNSALTLAPGATSDSITLNIHVAANAPLGTNSVTNTARVSTPDEIITGNNSASDPATIKANTNTVLGSAVNPSNYGQSVTFTATVTSTAGTPIGTVTFFDGATALGTGTLSGGVATLTTSTLFVGQHSLTAAYSGEASFNMSTSGALTQTINKATATIALSNLSQTYDGTTKSAVATTTPANLNVTYAYTQNGQSVAAPTNVGSYSVTATINDPNYQGSATGTLVIAEAPKLIQFSDSNYSASENEGIATITVTRSSDTSASASVNYATSDGTAHQRSDYTLASGTLSFAAGEVSKTFSVLVTDNARVDSSRTVNLTLTNPVGVALGSQSTAVLTIQDNDAAQPTTNPIDTTQFFVKQQYADFLNRVPDDGGLAYWSRLITSCNPTDQQCINSKRVTVSAAFFIEQEFQLTGNYVYRMYTAAYGQRPTYAQFMPDRAGINPNANLIEASKQQFAEQFVQRPEFIAKYPLTMTPDAFVDGLIATVKTETNGAVDLTSQRATLITTLQANGRERVVQLVTESAAFQSAEYNKAFVLMQYFGYLRRDPDQNGYDFWLDVLNNRVVNNYRGMVCAFTTSAEYQDRFSFVITRNDSVCGSIEP